MMEEEEKEKEKEKKKVDLGPEQAGSTRLHALNSWPYLACICLVLAAAMSRGNECRPIIIAPRRCCCCGDIVPVRPALHLSSPPFLVVVISCQILGSLGVVSGALLLVPQGPGQVFARDFWAPALASRHHLELLGVGKEEKECQRT